jgi:LSD1 subclass zinc finger protein
MTGDSSLTTNLACASCGAPLTPESGAVRVTCAYCKAVNDVASPGAVRVAKRLEAAGIRVPDRVMSLDEIEADIAQRQAAERERLRTARIVAAALGVAFLIVLGVILLVSNS